MEENKEEERRPTDAEQPNAKRRAQGTHKGRDDIDNDEENEVIYHSDQRIVNAMQLILISSSGGPWRVAA